MHIKEPQGNNLETLCSYSTDEFVTDKTQQMGFFWMLYMYP